MKKIKIAHLKALSACAGFLLIGSIFAEAGIRDRFGKSEASPDNRGTWRASAGDAGFKKGASCLFIGHSFFAPVAKKFDSLAMESGYPEHDSQIVFGSGHLGLPGVLWSNPKKREKIEGVLSSGEIEIFGMVSGGPRNAAYEDFARWIDLALKYNPGTTIFIGHPWMAGGPRMDSAEFDERTTLGGENAYTIVQELRKAYPKTDVIFVNYGRTGPEMRNRFDAGTLEDIKKLVGRRDGLFSDRAIGHGGKMLTDLSARVWLNALYGAELDKIGYGPYDPKDGEDITRKVIHSNRAYSE